METAMNATERSAATEEDASTCELCPLCLLPASSFAHLPETICRHFHDIQDKPRFTDAAKVNWVRSGLPCRYAAELKDQCGDEHARRDPNVFIGAQEVLMGHSVTRGFVRYSIQEVYQLFERLNPVRLLFD